MVDQLKSLVLRRLGHDSLQRLTADPRDERAQRDVGLTIDGAARVDAGFARELATIVERLDRRGGRQVLNRIYADMNVQAFDHDVAVGRDFDLVAAILDDQVLDANVQAARCASWSRTASRWART